MDAEQSQEADLQPRSGESRKKGIRKGIYLLPSTLTVGNILCGFYAVINATKGYSVLEQPEQAAVFFDNASRAIGYAVLLDGLDGRLARLTGATSEFGVELDSIADVLSFGLAPALLAFTWGYGSAPGMERQAWAASFMFVICGALRLARFNVLSRAPRFTAPGMTPKLDKRFFVGLPVPAAAGLIAATIHFFPEPLTRLAASPQTQPQGRMAVWGLVLAVAILSLLMVSTVRYTSFKSIGVRSNKPFITLPLLSLLVVGIWFYSNWTLLAIALGYVLHGPLLKVISLLRRVSRPVAQASDDPASS